MEPRHRRQVATLAILLLCFFVTSLLDVFIALGGLTGTMKQNSGESEDPVMADNTLRMVNVHTDPRQQGQLDTTNINEIKDKLAKGEYYNIKYSQKKQNAPKTEQPSQDSENINPEDEDEHEEKQEVGKNKEEHTSFDRPLSSQDSEPKEYFIVEDSKEDRAEMVRKRVYSCLPKFICEVHSQNTDKISTDLEREWLKMYSPGLLGDNLQEFQMAAHMGQLYRGLQPSPCQQLYTSCPVTMEQLKQFMSSVNIKKNSYNYR